MSGGGPHDGRGRLRRVLFMGMLVLAGLITIAVTLRPWEPLRYGRLEPPSFAVEDLPPPVAQRIMQQRRQVKRQMYEPEAWGQLGATFEAHDLDAEAIVCYDRAQRLDPKDFRWPYFLGLCRMVGHHEAALAHFERAVEIEDDYPPLHVHLAQAYFAASRLAEAGQHFERALELDPDLIAAHLGRAKVALARRRPQAALGHLHTALALGPRESQVHLQLAEAYRRLGRTEDARAHQREAVGGSQTEPMADPVHTSWLLPVGATLDWHRRRAERALARGQSAHAMIEWKRAAFAYPHSPQPHAELGNILVQLGRRPEAIQSFRTALELDPQQSLVRNNLGVQLLETDVREGMLHLEQSAAELPRNADAHFNLAGAYLRTNRTSAALEALHKVIEIDPNHVRAHFELGRLRGAEGQGEEAVEHFRIVTELEPDRRSAYVNLARALHELGRCAEAVEVLMPACERWPGDASTARALAWHLATCPEPDVRDGARAVSIMENLCGVRGCSDPRSLDVLAAAYAEVGDWASALLTVEQAQQVIESAMGGDASQELEAWREILAGREVAIHARRPIREGAGAPGG